MVDVNTNPVTDESLTTDVAPIETVVDDESRELALCIPGHEPTWLTPSGARDLANSIQANAPELVAEDDEVAALVADLEVFATRMGGV